MNEMNKLHTTLRPGVNAFMIVLWGTLASALFLLSKPHPVMIAFAGAVLGLIGGVMQTLSFRQAKQSFLEAKTMLDVRAKLKATSWGQRYIYFLWTGNILLVVIALKFSGNKPLAILEGFFTLMFIREIITLKPTFELSRLLKERTDGSAS